MEVLQIILHHGVDSDAHWLNTVGKSEHVRSGTVSRPSVVHVLSVVQDIDAELLTFVAGHDVRLDSEVGNVIMEMLSVLHHVKVYIGESSREASDNAVLQGIVLAGSVLHVSVLELFDTLARRVEHLVSEGGSSVVHASLVDNVQGVVLLVGQVVVNSFVNKLVNESHHIFEGATVEDIRVLRGVHSNALKKVNLLLVGELFFVEFVN